MDILDLPKYFDLISRTEGVISTFLNADWSGSVRRRGIYGALTELGSCMTSRNAPAITVSRQTTWRGIDIERLLFRYGIKVWDRGITETDFFFCVKFRQIKWAEYVLLRAGIPVTSSLRESQNIDWAARHSGPPPQRTGRKTLDASPKQNFFDFLR